MPVAASLRREPHNRHDRNAIRVEVGRRHVGYIARELAADLASVLDRARVREVRVPGIVRGGRVTAHGISLVLSPTSRGLNVEAQDHIEALHLGVHLWLERRLAPGPLIVLDGRTKRAYQVPWPPHEREGVG
ncbi:MAG TPA: HIRAN domain-containing protein [Actinomycetota bacterium]|nr:HIRAN domain-containing protein [Actinomycetota bacterium]